MKHFSNINAAAALLPKRVAVTTGTSSGLGRATALAFARQGAIVICADRKMDCQDGKPTHELIREQGHKSLFVETDVAEESSVQALIQTAVHEFGRLDIMVNNAGIAPEAAEPKPIWETSMKSFDAVHQVNVRGVLLGCKYASIQLLKQEMPTDRPAGKAGVIINIGSILGVLGKSGTPVYSASKGAVISMTRAIAMDLAPHHIHCNSILPGFTRTPMISALTDDSSAEAGFVKLHPLRRLGEPSEIADAAVFLASDMSIGITGLNLSVDGGLHSQLSV